MPLEEVAAEAASTVGSLALRVGLPSFGATRLQEAVGTHFGSLLACAEVRGKVSKAQEITSMLKSHLDRGRQDLSDLGLTQEQKEGVMSMFNALVGLAAASAHCELEPLN